MDKAQLRRQIRQRLAQLTPQERAEKSRLICRQIISSPTFQTASVVMAFMSMPTEVDTSGIILAAWQQGKTVVVPKILSEQRHIIPVEINSLEKGFESDKMGILNPISGVPWPFEDIDLVITPGLGFDRQGNRLGRGGGYYDKFLSEPKLHAAKWAVCFEMQLVDQVPHEPKDVPVDAIVTEKEIIYCNRQKS